MKFLFCMLILSWAVPGATAPQLKDVKSVYLFPMTGGFDQLLANRLTTDHVFRVVSDPKLADAVITDQLGAAFEWRINHIVPPAAAPVPGSPSQDVEPRASSFSRARGTIFLVDPKSKQVLWSLYQRPKNGTARELDHVAKKVVGNLSAALNPPVLKQ